jgi:hypothetical protein
MRPGRDKLAPRATKCTFLGYSHTQKGYRCYDSLTRRHYVNADITFHEAVLYFSMVTRQLSFILQDRSPPQAPMPMPPIQFGDFTPISVPEQSPRDSGDSKLRDPPVIYQIPITYKPCATPFSHLSPNILFYTCMC